MAVELLSLGTLDAVSTRTAPVGGVVWDAGRLLRIGDQEVAWSLPLASCPVMARSGRRLYLGVEDWLVCLDLETGQQVWAESCPGWVMAIEPDATGVEALAGDTIRSFDVYGRAGAVVQTGEPGLALGRTGRLRYVATATGVWRLPHGERPSLLYGCRCRRLLVRHGALQALVDGPGGTVLLEDDGLALVRPFPDGDSHWMEPWGSAEWAVTPRAGPGGVWVVDRRLGTRWQVPLPGVIRGMTVVGRAVAVALVDGDPTLALTHPDVSSPLLLSVDGVDAIVSEEERLYLTSGGRTTTFIVREG